MKLNVEEIHELCEAVRLFEEKTITVYESLTCDRREGHNRHFTTYTSFSFHVGRVGIAISGAQLIFSGAQCCYGIGVDNVVSFEKIENGLEIVEQFEQKTERLTTIKITE